MIDISKDGCMVYSPWRLQVGTYLALRASLPMGSPSIVTYAYSPLQIELAEVRWSKGQVVGLEFLRMRPAQSKRLSQFLRTVGSFRKVVKRLVLALNASL